MKRIAVLLLILVFQLGLEPEHSAAVQPSDTLLPPTTKGYLSVPDVDSLEESFNATQMGKLLEDPLMKPFLDDLRAQLEARLIKSDARLSITFEDLRKICGGEVCVAMVQPEEDENQHASVVLADITDREKETSELLDRLSKELKEKKAVRSVQTIGGVELVAWVLPKKEGATDSQRAFYFIKDRQLIASNHEATIKWILDHAGKTTGSRFAQLEAYRQTMARCSQAAGDTAPQVRWFVEPFGYAQAVRAAGGGRKRRGTDMLKVLSNQGFSAIRGAGGFVNFSIDGQDIRHRTFIYAPAVNKTGEKYNLAARMMKFPNGSELPPEAWMPAEVSNYMSFHWKMKEAFEYAKSLVDEVAGAPVFDDILESLEKDPNGPRINVREGLIKHLGERVILFSDYREPITPTSDRWVAAFQITNPAVVAKTLDKAMEADPDANMRMVGKQKVWEIQRESDEMDVEELDIGGIGFGSTEEEDEEESAPLLEHAALTVAYGYLIVASHLDYMEELFPTSGANQPISDAADFVRVQKQLASLGAGVNSARLFSRTDKAYHTTYDLIRQGKMPESEGILGVALNRLLGPEERGVVREQQIQGDKLPEYEKIRHYFGPAGIFALSEDNGWFVSGCLLPK